MKNIKVELDTLLGTQGYYSCPVCWKLGRWWRREDSTIKLLNRDVGNWNCSPPHRRADKWLVSIDFCRRNLARTSLWHKCLPSYCGIYSDTDPSCFWAYWCCHHRRRCRHQLWSRWDPFHHFASQLWQSTPTLRISIDLEAQNNFKQKRTYCSRN